MGWVGGGRAQEWGEREMMYGESESPRQGNCQERVWGVKMGCERGDVGVASFSFLLPGRMHQGESAGVRAYCVLHLLCGAQAQSHMLLLGEIASKGDVGTSVNPGSGDGDGVPSPGGGGVKGQKEETRDESKVEEGERGWRRAGQSSRGPACLRMGTRKKMMEMGKKLTNCQSKGAPRAAKTGHGDREAQPETEIARLLPLASWNLLGPANLLTFLSSFLAGVLILKAYHTPCYPNSHTLSSYCLPA